MEYYDITIKKGDKKTTMRVTQEMIDDVPNVLDYVMFKAKEFFDKNPVSEVKKASKKKIY